MKNLIKSSRKKITEINKHVQHIPLYHYQPMIADRAYCFPNTTIVGQTIIHSDSFVGSNTVIRGDLNKILIDENVYIYENCVLNTVHRILNSNEMADTKIGSRTIIGPGCTLTSCQIEEKVYIGENTIVGEGSLIRIGAIIGANSVIPPNREIPEFEVWTGNPIRFVKKVSRAEKTSHVYTIKKLFSELRKYPYEERAYGEAYLEYEKMEK